MSTTPKREPRSALRQPWMIPVGAQEPLYHELVKIHECRSNDGISIDWLVTPQVKKTFLSTTRYGDSATGASFYSLFQHAIHFWQVRNIQETLLPVIDPRITHCASGRAIEWSFTNWAVRHPFLTKHGDSVSIMYAHELKRTRRWKFDVYCRNGSPALYFHIHDGKTKPEKPVLLKTTIAQLHFFQFALEKGVLAIIYAKLPEIQEHMRTTLRSRKREGKHKKRRKLTANPDAWIACASGSDTFNL